MSVAASELHNQSSLAMTKDNLYALH